MSPEETTPQEQPATEPGAAPASTPPEAPQVDPTTADAPAQSDQLASDGEAVKDGVEEEGNGASTNS